MASPVVSLHELQKQYAANLITEEQIEHLYGVDTMKRILNNLMECYYGSTYV